MNEKMTREGCPSLLQLVKDIWLWTWLSSTVVLGVVVAAVTAAVPTLGPAETFDVVNILETGLEAGLILGCLPFLVFALLGTLIARLQVGRVAILGYPRLFFSYLAPGLFLALGSWAFFNPPGSAGAGPNMRTAGLFLLLTVWASAVGAWRFRCATPSEG